MKTLDFRQDKIVKDILYVRDSEPAKLKKITLKGMKSYLKALKTFGVGSKVAKDALAAVKEITKIHCIQDKLLLFILDNIDTFDIYAVEDAVLKLEQLNTSTYDSYSTLFDEVYKACEDKDSDRQLKPKEGISSLLTNNRYKTMVLGLANTFEDIKQYLPYEEEFWAYVEECKPKVIHTTGEGARVQCGVVPIRTSFEEDGILDGMDIHVPKIVDYETAMEAIKVYKRAHDLYLSLGKKMSELPTTNANEEQMQYREDIEALANKRFR